MTKIIEIEDVKYYESKVGLQCFVIDTDGKSWKTIVKKGMKDFFPGKKFCQD